MEEYYYRVLGKKPFEEKAVDSVIYFDKASQQERGRGLWASGL